ncbi:STAS domain-containing protein [Hamadaea flava]|uniref:STAS domain-containing protein n=1 Tax=Hamadaea flava TaxID=1742688 RepID=A0ABV8LNR1_9ACTN
MQLWLDRGSRIRTATRTRKESASRSRRSRTVAAHPWAQEDDALIGSAQVAGFQQTRDQLAAAVDRGGHVVVEMSQVPFVDSAGIAVLVNARRRAHAAGGTLWLRDVQPAVGRVLQVMGLLEWIRPSVEPNRSAFAAAGRAAGPRAAQAVAVSIVMAGASADAVVAALCAGRLSSLAGEPLMPRSWMIDLGLWRSIASQRVRSS